MRVIHQRKEKATRELKEEYLVFLEIENVLDGFEISDPLPL